MSQRIIHINEYKKRRNRTSMKNLLEKELVERSKKGFDFDDASYFAEKLLSMISYDRSSFVPIVEIAKQLGFKIFQFPMKKELSGFIGIGQYMKDHYGHDKVICINIDDELGHQRFVIAHELGHYLFNFIPDPQPAFYDTYFKNDHKPFREQLANRFAANLLMPEKDFLKCIEKQNISEDTVSKLQKKFVVQDKAIIKRLLEV